MREMIAPALNKKSVMARKLVLAKAGMRATQLTRFGVHHGPSLPREDFADFSWVARRRTAVE
jgi:hypothetical protein